LRLKALLAPTGLALICALPAAAQDAAAPAPADTAEAAVEAIAPTEPEPEAEADPAIDLFVAKCASCHTVGKGARIGPDLSGALERRERAWLERIIQVPSRVLDVDPVARELVAAANGVRMPDLGLNGEQVGLLIDLIGRCSAEPCDLVGKFTPVTEATPEHLALGRALFTGVEPFKAGAAPCMSCHDVATLSGVPGGTLSKDLTHAYARLGDEGLDAALSNPSFLVMNKVFADHPLEKDEVFALRAFLYETNRSESEGSEGWSPLLVAIIGCLLVMAILNAFWSRRLQGVRPTVRARKGTLA